MKANQFLLSISLLLSMLTVQAINLIASTEDANLARMTKSINSSYSSATGNEAVLEKSSEGNLFLTFNSAENATQLLPIGRDAVVIVINKNNPKAATFVKTGIGKTEIQKLVLSKDKSIAFSCSIACEAVLDFVAPNQNNLPSVADFIYDVNQNDIRFVLFSEIQAKPESDILIVPFDRNDNGLIDNNEAFYTSTEEFSRAIWLGKYPKALSVTVYLAANATGDANQQFINWLFSSENDAIAANGMIPIYKGEHNAALKANLTNNLQETDASAPNSFSWLIVLLGGVIAVVLATMGIFWLFLDRTPVDETDTEPTMTFSAESLKFPGGRMYDKSHTWAFMEEDGTVKVGIDDFLKHIFGTNAQVNLFKTGTSFTKGDIMATITHKGRKISVLSPVSGRIVAINRTETENIVPLNPEWLYKVEAENWKREQSLLSMADQYRDWLRSEYNRFKEFIVNALQSTSSLQTQAVMLDGGELMEGLMETADPQVWEEFQTKFLNKQS